MRREEKRREIVKAELNKCTFQPAPSGSNYLKSLQSSEGNRARTRSPAGASTVGGGPSSNSYRNYTPRGVGQHLSNSSSNNNNMGQHGHHTPGYGMGNQRNLSSEQLPEPTNSLEEFCPPARRNLREKKQLQDVESVLKKSQESRAKTQDLMNFSQPNIHSRGEITLASGGHSQSRGPGSRSGTPGGTGTSSPSKTPLSSPRKLSNSYAAAKSSADVGRATAASASRASENARPRKPPALTASGPGNSSSSSSSNNIAKMLNGAVTKSVSNNSNSNTMINTLEINSSSETPNNPPGGDNPDVGPRPWEGGPSHGLGPTLTSLNGARASRKNSSQAESSPITQSLSERVSGLVNSNISSRQVSSSRSSDHPAPGTVNTASGAGTSSLTNPQFKRSNSSGLKLPRSSSVPKSNAGPGAVNRSSSGVSSGVSSNSLGLGAGSVTGKSSGGPNNYVKAGPGPSGSTSRVFRDSDIVTGTSSQAQATDNITTETEIARGIDHFDTAGVNLTTDDDLFQSPRTGISPNPKDPLQDDLPAMLSAREVKPPEPGEQ